MEERFGSRAKCTMDKVSRAKYDTDTWMTDDTGNVINFYVGSLKSKKVINGYAKGQRIEMENKQYIRESWRASGLIGDGSDGKSIERLELRLKKEGVDDLHTPGPKEVIVCEETGEVVEEQPSNVPLDWKCLRSAQYLVGAFKASVTGFYGFVRDNGKHRSSWDDIETIRWDVLEAATVIRLPRTKRSSQVWRAKHTAYKILSDCAVQRYLQDAVIDHVNDQLTGFIPPADIVESLAWGASLELTELQQKELQRLSVLTAEKLALSIADHLTETVLEELPEVMAWAIADEHNITSYLARRLRNDKGAKDYPRTFTPKSVTTLNAA
jgi:hypothetical protein